MIKSAISPLLKSSIAEYLEIIAHSLLIFKDKVNHGAEWDIKVDESWTTKFDEIDIMPVDSYYDKFVWRDEVVNREELGNITYGYLGSYLGIDDTVLYIGGGYANKSYPINNSSESETMKNIKKALIFLNPELYSESSYFGDLPDDYENIKKGIEYYEKDY